MESGFPLGRWLANQSNKKRKGLLINEQMIRLESIGMTMEDSPEEQWSERYRQAEKYYQMHGNLFVQTNNLTEDGFKLGIWIDTQRKWLRANRKSLTKERRQLLDEIGMIWDCCSKASNSEVLL